MGTGRDLVADLRHRSAVGRIGWRVIARGGIRPLFTDHELLGNFTAGSYVFRDDFLKKNSMLLLRSVSGKGAG